MTKGEFLRLYEKYRDGSISPEEEKLLELYEDDFVLGEHEWDVEAMGHRRDTDREIYGVIERETGESSGARERSKLSGAREMGESSGRGRRGWPMVRVAAVLLPLFLVGGWIWLRVGGHQEQESLPVKPVAADIKPGGNKAILTLENGVAVVLDSAANGLISRQGAVQVLKTADGRLAYNKASGMDKGMGVDQGAGKYTGEVVDQGAGMDKAVGMGQPVVMYNKISTPRGGQYQVSLPDGTKVWLNAASSIRFPTAFARDERRVEVTGECFFEIAKEASRPFIVSVQAANGRNMNVQVLGTSFDVMAYEEEDAIRTTLVDGAVRLEKDGKGLVLKPGQQGSLREGGELKIESGVDPEAATAWKNGLFQFDGNNIKSVMRQLARWYDVDVEYRGNVSARLAGFTPRAENVSKALKVLELTGGVHFTIEGRKIIVTP